jgi:hypothetical protein
MVIDLENAKSIKYQSLGQGVTVVNNESHFFYGKRILYRNQETTIVVLDNKQILLDKEEVNGKIVNNIFNSGIYYRTEPTSTQYESLSINAISKFVNSQYDEKSVNLIFDKLVSTLNTYIEFHDVQDLKLISLYILSTYCFMMFNATGTIYITGSIGTGKTKLGFLTASMCHSFVDSSDPTPSSLFRLIEADSPTLLIDDFEGFDPERKQYIEQILKRGYKKGGTSSRVELDTKTKTYKIVNFSNYSPKIVTNTTDIDPAVLSRSFIIRLIKTNSEKGRLIPNYSDDCWQQLRDDISIYILNNWKTIKQTYDSIQTDKLNSRDLEISKPLLTFAKMISEELYTEIVSYLVEKCKDRDIIDIENDWTYLFFTSCIEYCMIKGDGWHNISDILAFFKTELKTDYKLSNVWVGKRLYQAGFERRRLSRNVEYYISLIGLLDYLKRLGLPTYPSLITLKYRYGISFDFEDTITLFILQENNCARCRFCKTDKVYFINRVNSSEGLCDDCLEKSLTKYKHWQP